MSDDINVLLQSMNQKLDTLLARAVPAQSGPATLVYPDADGITRVAGMQIRADEPIASDWLPSQLYRSANQGRIAADEPSNAPFDASVPKRSPGGYVLIYTTRKADGTPDYSRPGYIVFGDRTFTDEAELAGWRKDNAEAERVLRQVGYEFPANRP